MNTIFQYILYHISRIVAIEKSIIRLIVFKPDRGGNYDFYGRDKNEIEDVLKGGYEVKAEVEKK